MQGADGRTEGGREGHVVLVRRHTPHLPPDPSATATRLLPGLNPCKIPQQAPCAEGRQGEG